MEKQTSFESAVASVSQQFSTFLAAPVPFLLVLAIVAIGIWRYFVHHYSGRLDAKDALLTLRQAQLDDYKEKLSGASPEEARARVDALEKWIEDQLSALAPRSLSEDQRKKIVHELEKQNGQHVTIAHEVGAADSVALAKSIGAAFLAARWTISTPIIMGLSNGPVSGIGVVVPDQNNLTEPQRAIINAFKIAKIDIDIQSGFIAENCPQPVAEIIISSPLS